jgi:hypothetical protein
VEGRGGYAAYFSLATEVIYITYLYAFRVAGSLGVPRSPFIGFGVDSSVRIGTGHGVMEGKVLGSIDSREDGIGEADGWDYWAVGLGGAGACLLQ